MMTRLGASLGLSVIALTVVLGMPVETHGGIVSVCKRLVQALGLKRPREQDSLHFSDEAVLRSIVSDRSRSELERANAYLELAKLKLDPEEKQADRQAFQFVRRAEELVSEDPQFWEKLGDLYQHYAVYGSDRFRARIRIAIQAFYNASVLYREGSEQEGRAWQKMVRAEHYDGQDLFLEDYLAGVSVMQLARLSLDSQAQTDQHEPSMYLEDQIDALKASVEHIQALSPEQIYRLVRQHQRQHRPEVSFEAAQSFIYEPLFRSFAGLRQQLFLKAKDDPLMVLDYYPKLLEILMMLSSTSSSQQEWNPEEMFFNDSWAQDSQALLERSLAEVEELARGLGESEEIWEYFESPRSSGEGSGDFSWAKHFVIAQIYAHARVEDYPFLTRFGRQGRAEEHLNQARAGLAELARSSLLVSSTQIEIAEDFLSDQ